MPFRKHQWNWADGYWEESGTRTERSGCCWQTTTPCSGRASLGSCASYGGMDVVAEAPNDAEALMLARKLSPDVVIMQVQLPFQRALETLEAMRSFADPPKVVIVTMFESPRYVRGLTGVGASAYLLKTSSSEHLVAAVRAAALDPSSENAVVGMPRQMLEDT